MYLLQGTMAMQAVYSKRNAIFIFISGLILTSCMVGPNFRSPPPPPVKQFTEKSLPKKTVSSESKGGNTQAFVKSEDIPILWWELFHSKTMNQLIRVGLANNPSMVAASAALRQAQENVNVQIGTSLWPAFNATGAGQRQRYSTLAIGGVGGGDRGFTFNLANAAITGTYTLDVWGAARRQIESLRAQVDYQQFELIGTYLTLTSNIATTAVNMASYKAQIEVTKVQIKEEEAIFNILKKQYQLGAISNADVLTQQTTLEQTKATLPVLQKNLAVVRHSLSALVGAFPDGLLPEINLDDLNLPANLPITLPSNLVRQRPDVRAAEALIHAATAQVGVATANLLPQFTLTGSYGWLNTSFIDLFTRANTVWSILGQVSQPIFQGGALLATRRAKIAAYEQVDAQYRQVVLQAFKEVADSLAAIETSARALKAEAAAEKAARLALKLTFDQYRLGGTNYINLLNAQRQYQQTRINRIKAQAARFTNTVALFQSLGGGWWHKPFCDKECV